MRKVVWYLPYIVMLALGAVVASLFGEDGYFVILALVTLLVLAIIVHWSWTAYIGEQPWYQQGEER